MARSPLIPESQLVFSAELAAAVGLEEAVLLQQIRGLYLHQPATRRQGLMWLHVSRAYLLQLLPFWTDADLQRLCGSLEALGLLAVDRQAAAPDSLLIAIDEGSGAEPEPRPPPVTGPRDRQTPVTEARPRAAVPATERAAAQSRRPRSGEGQPLPLDFQPSEDMLELLERFHGVPRAFALEQLEDFTLYWRERGSAGHAWQNKFKQHVQFQWARHQQTGTEHAGQRGTDGTRRTRDSSLEHDLTDTSWAE